MDFSLSFLFNLKFWLCLVFLNVVLTQYDTKKRGKKKLPTSVNKIQWNVMCWNGLEKKAVLQRFSKVLRGAAPTRGSVCVCPEYFMKHRPQLPRIWDRALVRSWRSCGAWLPHVPQFFISCPRISLQYWRGVFHGALHNSKTTTVKYQPVDVKNGFPLELKDLFSEYLFYASRDETFCSVPDGFWSCKFKHSLCDRITHAKFQFIT